jgi:predicted Zn-dependent protease
MYIGVSRSTMWSRVFRSDRDVFGWGGKEVAVMTYGPFLSSRSGESPDWERLVARTTKQIICTVGSAFEVGRCRNPKCPMRVVFDLRSVDAKGYEPCKDCAARLRKRY